MFHKGAGVLPSVYCPMSVVFCPLPIVHGPWSVGHCPLSIVQCPSSIVHCPMSQGVWGVSCKWGSVQYSVVEFAPCMVPSI